MFVKLRYVSQDTNLLLAYTQNHYSKRKHDGQLVVPRSNEIVSEKINQKFNTGSRKINLIINKSTGVLTMDNTLNVREVKT